MSDIVQKACKRGSDCPEIPQLFEAMELAATDPRRRLAEEHLQICPACHSEWSLFQQFETGEVRPEEREAVDFVLQRVRAQHTALRIESETAANRRSLWQRIWTPSFWTPAALGGAAIAAAVLVLTIGIASQWQARHSSTAVYSDDQTLRSRALEITTPLRDLKQPPAVIEWKPVPGAASYAIAFTEVDGTRIFYAKVTSSTLSLPDQPRKLLALGKVLLLDVTASDSSSREIARSGMVRIRVSSSAK